VFGRKPSPADSSADSAEPSDDHDPRSAKGRPTPTRREAQAARKQQLRIPKDPKAAKKAARERDQVDRARRRQGMLAGDPKYLPARDQGPGKAFARDFVDSRITLAEYFIFIAVGVLVLGFFRDPAVQSLVSLAFFALTAVIAIDTVILLVTLRRRAKAALPEAADRKGITLYAAMRTLQLRRLRLPPPRVRRGGAPVEPKQPK